MLGIGAGFHSLSSDFGAEWVGMGRTLLEAPLGLSSRKRELAAELGKDWALKSPQYLSAHLGPRSNPLFAHWPTSGTPQPGPQWPRLGYFYLEVMLAGGIKGPGDSELPLKKQA